MARLIYYLIIILTVQVSSCDINNAGASNVGAIRRAETKSPTPSAALDGRRVNFDGVSFHCETSALCEIETSEVPAVPVEDNDQKSDNAHPRYVSFKFGGDYRRQSEASQFKPEIRVYSVQEFRENLAKSSDAIQTFDKEVRDLTKLLNEEARGSENTMPFLLFSDLEHQFIARLAHVSFREGKGVIYLTELDSGPSIINNGALTYVFQGLTNDGRNYVLATFPIRLDILPDNRDAARFEDYRLPPYFYKAEDRRQNELQYQEYLTHVKNILNGLESDRFQPDLKFFDRLMASLEVQK